MRIDELVQEQERKEMEALINDYNSKNNKEEVKEKVEVELNTITDNEEIIDTPIDAQESAPADTQEEEIIEEKEKDIWDLPNDKLYGALEEKNKNELIEIANNLELGIKSSTKKDELIEMIIKARPEDEEEI